MTFIVDGTNGLTFNNATTQASAGSVLQVQSVTKSDIFSTSSTSFVDVTGLSVSVTPKFTTSKILVFVNICGGNDSNNVQLNLVRNSTTIAQSTGSGFSNNTAQFAFPGGYQITTIPINFLDSPATTSAVTYKIQIKATGGGTYVNSRATDNGYGGISTITVMEVAG